MQENKAPEREMTELEQKGAALIRKNSLDQKEKPAIVEADGVRAGYKIEVHFGPGRSSFKEYPAFVSLWESGKHFHGGGDSLMYWCIDCRLFEKNPRGAWERVLAILDGKESQERHGCGHPIPAASMSVGIGCCPNCKKIVDTDFLTNPLPFIGTSQELARLVARYFHVLKDNSDIYCKYHPKDIRYIGMGAEKGLETARKLKGMFIYPLKNILKDVSAGAKLEDRFKAFFNS